MEVLVSCRAGEMGPEFPPSPASGTLDFVAFFKRPYA